eukprot:SM000164S02235  [mRNA]  locus=s164:61815:66246:+ [translate_table: standard]
MLSHLHRLPQRYLFSVDPSSYDYVLLHMRLLSAAREAADAYAAAVAAASAAGAPPPLPKPVPELYIRRVDFAWPSWSPKVTQHSPRGPVAAAAIAAAAMPAAGLVSRQWSRSRVPPHPRPTFGGTSGKPDPLALVLPPPPGGGAGGHSGSRSEAQAAANGAAEGQPDGGARNWGGGSGAGFELTMAYTDKPGLLRMVTSVLGHAAVELDVREAHIFTTNDGMALQAFPSSSRQPGRWTMEELQLKLEMAMAEVLRLGPSLSVSPESSNRGSSGGGAGGSNCSGSGGPSADSMAHAAAEVLQQLGLASAADAAFAHEGEYESANEHSRGQSRRSSSTCGDEGDNSWIDEVSSGAASPQRWAASGGASAPNVGEEGGASSSNGGSESWSSGGGGRRRQRRRRRLVRDARALVEQMDLQDWAIDFRELMLRESRGTGSTGSLYAGTYRSQDVAVKVMVAGQDVGANAGDLDEPVGTAAADILETFQQEVMMLRRIRHKNVVQFIGACSAWPLLCIVTELMAGGSVRDVLDRRGRGFELGEAVRILRDTAHGMDFFHKRGMIHRDLKAANLLMNEQGVVKVADFGVARVEPGPLRRAASMRVLSGMEMANVKSLQDHHSEAAIRTSFTKKDEVLEHQVYNHKADVYSYGITIWELLTGGIPYAGLTPIQAAYGVILRQLRPDIPSTWPPTLASLAQACWDEDPTNRPEFSEILLLLDKLEHGKPPPSRAWRPFFLLGK